MTASFIPQPYPLFAIPLNVVQDPARFEVTELAPIRLVLGWTTDDAGERLPVLEGGGGPSGTPWAGPILYEETRDRALETMGEVKRATRASVRTGRLMDLFSRWETWGDKLSERVEQRLDRRGPS